MALDHMQTDSSPRPLRLGRPGLLPLLPPGEIALNALVSSEGVRSAMDLVARLNGPKSSEPDAGPILDDALQALGPLRLEDRTGEETRVDAGQKDATEFDHFFEIERVSGQPDQVFAYGVLIAFRDLVNDLGAAPSSLSPVEKAHLRLAFAELAGLPGDGNIPDPREEV